MSLTDQAIARIRGLIRDGELAPGSKLPAEPQLAAQLGLSRNTLREAVKALVVARVLEIRRGAGTYVTSLEPGLLLEGLGGVVELLQGDTVLELFEVRRMLEPAATGVAATRATAEDLAEVERHLAAMQAAGEDIELLNLHDAAFHRAVVRATRNETLVALLEHISGHTLRARIWRGTVDAAAADRTVTEHEAIYQALVAQDPEVARITALLHVSATERWLREHLSESERLAADPPEPDRRPRSDRA
ncbi:GntR family transcriptional regulator [Streptomyces tateyamensis]|uniref:GntR family transcriptional regulator n=1 Tax=Streptomyces tateyamensis TaxID=565073 RepID=A0A2V4N6C3_9ACTN|nr:FadR/GntR family transcriptional regulator [Streptomyces tateyamensis]PYC79567.1 GntR family transcriptional regulator [Streptomyces tateyamensis]